MRRALSVVVGVMAMVASCHVREPVAGSLLFAIGVFLLAWGVFPESKKHE